MLYVFLYQWLLMMTSTAAIEKKRYLQYFSPLERWFENLVSQPLLSILQSSALVLGFLFFPRAQLQNQSLNFNQITNWSAKLVSHSLQRTFHARSVTEGALSLSHVWLCNPVDWSLPGSSVHGISQARIVERVAISSSRGSFWPGDQTLVLCSSCSAGGFFSTEPPAKPETGEESAKISPKENIVWMPLYLFVNTSIYAACVCDLILL